MAAEPLPTTLLEDRLPDWWWPLGLNLDGDRLALRRQGIEALRAGLSLDRVVDAVAYAHGNKAAGQRVIEAVRAAARSADGAFAGDVGDAEPPAMVAAALVDQLAVHPGSQVSTLISLLVLSADYGKHSPAVDGMRLPDYATRQLEHAAASARQSGGALAAPSTRSMVTSAMKALPAIPETGGGVTDTVVHGVLAGHAEILVKLASTMDAVIARAASEHGVLREQLRQQTWLLESWCETAELPWSSVNVEARPLVAAVELAERTRHGAPAADAESLLGSVLIAAGSSGPILPLAGIAAAAPLLEGQLMTEPNAMLFPVATALWHYRDREGGTAWKTAAKGVLPARKQSPIVLGVQAYREALALRVLGNE